MRSAVARRDAAIWDAALDCAVTHLGVCLTEPRFRTLPAPILVEVMDAALLARSGGDGGLVRAFVCVCVCVCVCVHARPSTNMTHSFAADAIRLGRPTIPNWTRWSRLCVARLLTRGARSEGRVAGSRQQSVQTQAWHDGAAQAIAYILCLCGVRFRNMGNSYIFC